MLDRSFGSMVSQSRPHQRRTASSRSRRPGSSAAAVSNSNATPSLVNRSRSVRSAAVQTMPSPAGFQDLVARAAVRAANRRSRSGSLPPARPQRSRARSGPGRACSGRRPRASSSGPATSGAVRSMFQRTTFRWACCQNGSLPPTGERPGRDDDGHRRAGEIPNSTRSDPGRRPPATAGCGSREPGRSPVRRPRYGTADGVLPSEDSRLASRSPKLLDRPRMFRQGEDDRSARVPLSATSPSRRAAGGSAPRVVDRRLVAPGTDPHGRPVLDNMDLTAVSEAAAELYRWEFAVTFAPLIVRGGQAPRSIRSRRSSSGSTRSPRLPARGARPRRRCAR